MKNALMIATLLLVGNLISPAQQTDAAAKAEPATASQPASAPAGDANVDESNDYIVAPLPKDDAAKLAGDDKDLARLSEAMQSVKLVQYGKSGVCVFQKVPFAAAKEPVGLLLDGKKESGVVKLGKAVQYVYVLLAVLDPDKVPPAQLTILRDDGVPTRIEFIPGVNCGPGVGQWEGKLEPRKDVPGKGSVALEVKNKDGAPVRMFLLEWHNDNEWYPVTDLKFDLLDVKAKTRFVVLGVTGANAKKK